MPFETVAIKDVSGEQVIKIPDKFKIDDDKVYLKKMGNTGKYIVFDSIPQSLASFVW